MGVRSRRFKSKRRKAATVSVGDSGGSGGGGVDLIRGVAAPRAPLPSSMGVQSRSDPKRRRRAGTPTVSIGDVDADADGDSEGEGEGGGGVDLISSLNDDLLLRILDLVPEAGNVVRTHALSRRWRGLLTGVAALRFKFSRWRQPCRSEAAAQRYIAFIDGVLALRAAAGKEPAFVEDLAIKFDISFQETGRLVPLSVVAAQGWIRYALQHELKSFVLKLTMPWRWRLGTPADGDDNGNDIEHPVMNLDAMGIYAKMETLHLRLGGAELRLPSSTMSFPSLVDLSLEDIKVPDGGDYLLSCLVSSACCPHLHKVRLRQLRFELSTMLRVEAGTLVELSLETMLELQFLELRTPSLQVLHIEDSFDLDGFTVSAPRLENLKFCVQQPLYIDGIPDQLSSVGTLKIHMFSHGRNNFYSNDASLLLLQSCRLSTKCLEVSFEIPKTKHQTVDIIKGRIPLLPHVTHLAVHIKLWEQHSSGPGVACLLAQCNNIKCLSLELHYIIIKSLLQKKQLGLDLLCDNNSCHWRSHEFLLAHLQEVEFKKLMGTDCEFQFIQSILTNATGIQKVTISFNRDYWPKGRKHAVKLPPLDGGLWTTCKDAMSSSMWSG